ncbi:hypothetical protein CNMCM5793_002753 [Aspergillus hiratsukae]|uniref:Uroporphyrinogen decarboxylase n=1 Tax=Aspergillus hiratsukae TaxID=1194566 RepID=A0A8H6PDQ6_9EURO|nr:hypothetical protein CNMCM5793_002753 [Aspergillus hiratsukae]KAF7167136.1 hypothetical protein CNMCM6106_002821 [Aspergillus hiratsukae]
MVVSYQHRIESIRYVERQTAGFHNLFVASAGPKIYTYAAETGRQLAIWPEAANAADSTVVGVAPSSEGDEPSAKKRKVSPAPEQTARGPQSETSTAWSTIPILAVSSDGNYVVAVTGEDKCLRVFEIEESGNLKQLSERHMPKRPSAIALVDDDKTILCGDKFGDVYSLPLIDTGKSSIAPKVRGKMKPNQPAATTLTVHSKRNLASLEQQLQHYGQKEKTAEEKPTSAFELHLILGHVSMLTALAYVSIPLDTASGRKRSYILTADRDEHIRVSRGPPQAHIIENYCLGHTSFVSSLCIPDWAQEYLISGGGDDYLLVWRWKEGRLAHKVSLVEDGTDSEVVVRGIWALSLTKPANSQENANVILVALDGSSKLLCFTLESDGSLKAQNPIQASGNVLDLTVPAEGSSIVVSIDAVRKANSTQEWRTTPPSPSTLIEAFRLKPASEGLNWEPTSEAITAQMNSEGTSEIPADLEDKQKKEFNDSLYSLGNLRKKNFARGPKLLNVTPPQTIFSFTKLPLIFRMQEKFEPLKNDLLLRAARGERVPRPPIWVMRQAGRYLPEYHEAKGNRDFFECCRTPEIASTLTIQPVDRYDGLIDAAIIFSDILVIPQAMGMQVEMVDKKGPHFPAPLKSPDDGQYEKVMQKEVNVKEELDYVYKAITLTRHKLKGRVPLIGFCGAPWTLLCYMVEGGGTKLFVQSKTWIYKYPKESQALLQKIAEICVEYLALQVASGAQLVQVFDSWAGEMSPAAFKTFSLPYLRYISTNLPKRLDEMGLERVPMTVFAKGAWYALEDLCESGYNVVGLDWLHDPAEAMHIAKGRVTIQGNADPGILYGSREAITEAVEVMVKGFQGGKQGWIANLGHGITPFVKPDDLKFFFEEIHRLTAA